MDLRVLMKMREEGQLFISRKGMGVLAHATITARGVSQIVDAIELSNSRSLYSSHLALPHLPCLIDFTDFIVETLSNYDSDIRDLFPLSR